MKTIAILLLAVSMILTSSCSKSGPDASETGSAQEEVFPEAQVVDIVNAADAKDATKVAALLQANPKLGRAKLQSGGPLAGWPLLMIAAVHGDQPMVELLLRSGADVNDHNNDGEVALHYAASRGYKDIVLLLLDHKATVNVKSEAGLTPLQVAVISGKPDVVALLKQRGAKE